MKPSEIAGIERYQRLQKIFREHLDMQVDDVRAILTLAKPGGHGCNFAAAALLANLLCGMSVVLYHAAGLPPVEEPRERGERLRRLMVDLFPRVSAAIHPHEVVNVIYEYARNELTHTLGLRYRGNTPRITLRSRPLTAEQIDELESAPNLPSWAGPLLDKPVKKEYAISVPGLYWAIWRVLERLVAEPAHVGRAEELLKNGEWVP